MTVYESWEDSLQKEKPNHARMFAMTTKGSSIFSSMQFKPGDWFVFGSEGHGLPGGLREGFPQQQRIRLPMQPH